MKFKEILLLGLALVCILAVIVKMQHKELLVKPAYKQPEEIQVDLNNTNKPIAYPTERYDVRFTADSAFVNYPGLKEVGMDKSMFLKLANTSQHVLYLHIYCKNHQ